MNQRRKTLEQLTLLATNLASSVQALATRSRFSAEEILADVAIEARRWLMRKRWGPPQQTEKTPETPPHHPKSTEKGDTR